MKIRLQARLRQIFPEWLLEPRFLITLTAAFAMAALALLAWIGVYAQQERHDNMKARVETQRILKPAVEGLRRQTRSLSSLVNAGSLDMPDSLPHLLDTLRLLAVRAGMKNAEFVPDPMSVGSGTGLRLDLRCEGSTDAVRQFIVLLSNQKWVERMDHQAVRTVGEQRELTMSLQAGFAKTPGLGK